MARTFTWNLPNGRAAIINVADGYPDPQLALVKTVWELTRAARGGGPNAHFNPADPAHWQPYMDALPAMWEIDPAALAGVPRDRRNDWVITMDGELVVSAVPLPLLPGEVPPELPPAPQPGVLARAWRLVFGG